MNSCAVTFQRSTHQQGRIMADSFEKQIDATAQILEKLLDISIKELQSQTLSKEEENFDTDIS